MCGKKEFTHMNSTGIKGTKYLILTVLKYQKHKYAYLVME